MADLGTLLPLMIALVVINHLHPTPVLLVVALAYIASGLYYRIPMPVQPLKALSATAISLGLSAAVIGAAGLLTGLVLLFLSLTNLITPLVRFFPKAVIRGIQLSIGLILLRSGALLAIKPPQTAIDRTFSLGSIAVSLEAVLFIAAVALFFLFRKSQRFPATLAIVILGVGASIALGASPGNGPSWAADRPWLVWPQGEDFLTALVLLVIPQLPLTLGNAVVSTTQTAGDYFQDSASRVTPRALTTS
ncbi:MAG: putative sulfate/molybdate transporter, partial [Chloroflexota bacterium]